VSDGANFFLNKTLGEDFMESLEKFELWKPGTKTVIDHEEIKTALQIVPRTLMSFLISKLAPLNIGETVKVNLNVYDKRQSGFGVPVMTATKHERDVYSGEIEDSTEKYTKKKVAEFKYRSIPGIGLIIMSTFELYNVDDLDKSPVAPDVAEKVQKLIDERLALHDLIGKVVEKKLSERDAIQQLMLAKLSSGNLSKKKLKKSEDSYERSIKNDVSDDMKNKIVAAALKVTPSSEDCPIQKVLDTKCLRCEGMGCRCGGRCKECIDHEAGKHNKKGSPVKGFLDKRKKKLDKKEYAVEMMKGEHVSCPDCGQNIFNGEVFSGCVCLGDDMDKKIYLTKTEKGVKVRFGKGWDVENIEMLLDVMRRKRG
jgi:hypothetical protein